MVGDQFEVAGLSGVPVLFVMAANAEYGVHLKARIAPLMTGVGPIESALATGIALEGLKARGRLPRLVVSLGSAGSRVLEQGAVYQASSVAWRDIDASPLGFTRGVTPFLDHPVHTALPTPIPGLATARLSTGANIVSGAAYAGIDAEMVDMESFAVLRACQRFELPMIGLRGISDGAADLHHFDDWTQLLHVIDEKLADAIDRLAAEIESGAFDPRTA
ncbi:5'-methylthioadenosine/S-adenosylhomocysteine nucleosidase [Fulvimarina sp. 2208YS6-2-32]|uniref:5'-methylthioadenosine/S-adenosylhomocysteine nucleosidase n=1 Tax=Fulvimarina uroteuthidis TaxID=3098149 RepID=A0ABU5HYY2_9HYPH|nr:5'-methylthioadenosine/S-adenosylhomocysteine nucleosidase [Fulvimarina sp. 2208YS6-2-32]MDY8107973.1 5'-methylthioadenosine/S-adenosylhomocysteine nucleosidase [Fulvimarina sp. 2208YS6-2-32]